MKTQEAIELLEQQNNLICHDCVHPAMVGWCENHCRISEAFDMAIGALKAQADGDTINRKEAIGAICSACGKIDCDQMETCEKIDIPPINSSEIPNSSNTISRRAMIDALMEFDKKLRKINWYQYPYTEHECRSVDEAIVKIANLPPAQPEPQWIPCSERLPNREEYIRCNGLFIVSDGDRAYAEYFDIYDKKCFGEPVMHGFRADRAITAWMPLPEPYAERRTNE